MQSINIQQSALIRMYYVSGRTKNSQTMKKPTLITLIHKETKESKPFISYRGYPTADDLCEWVDIGDGKKEKREMWTAYVDTRYKAKLRLWRYIIYTKKCTSIQ